MASPTTSISYFSSCVDDCNAFEEAIDNKSLLQSNDKISQTIPVHTGLWVGNKIHLANVRTILIMKLSTFGIAYTWTFNQKCMLAVMHYLDLLNWDPEAQTFQNSHCSIKISCGKHIVAIAFNALKSQHFHDVIFKQIGLVRQLFQARSSHF